MLLAFDGASPPGADISFNGPMLALPYSLQRLGFTYVRNSLKTVYQGGSLVTLAANQFGTTYDAVTGLHAYEPEPAATNLATNSAGAAATWTVSNVVDAVTPIAGFAASLQFGDNSVDRTAFKSISFTVSTAYTLSVFVVMDDESAPSLGLSSTTGDFSITQAGTVIINGSPSVTRISGPLYRVSATRVATSTATQTIGIRKHTGQSAKGFRIIGIQVETGSRATSYIATAGATVTRAADVLSCAVANIPGFNAAGYTLVVDGRRDVTTSVSGRAIVIDDGTTNNRAFVIFSTGGSIETGVTSGGVSQASTTETAYGASRQKIAYSISANSFLRAVNGVAGTADTSGSVPVAPTTLHVGLVTLLAGSQLNGYIYGFKLIPVALNQAQTTAQTS